MIVAEEVKTSEGEVIGMFLEELIPRGLTFNQTLSLIKEQGGLVYVPHPFDQACAPRPSYRLLVENVHRIDVIETYNARNYLGSFNLEAERFASKYNLAAGCGQRRPRGAGHRQSHVAHASLQRAATISSTLSAAPTSSRAGRACSTCSR